jgi:hypothetical protein
LLYRQQSDSYALNCKAVRRKYGGNGVDSLYPA